MTKFQIVYRLDNGKSNTFDLRDMDEVRRELVQANHSLHDVRQDPRTTGYTVVEIEDGKSFVIARNGAQ